MTDVNNMDDAEFLAEMRGDFLESVPSELETCESCLLAYEKTQDLEQITEFKRFVHSIKGGARCVGLNDFSNFLHLLETKLQRASQEKRLKEFINFALPFIDLLRGYIGATVDGAGLEQASQKVTDALARFE